MLPAPVSLSSFWFWRSFFVVRFVGTIPVPRDTARADGEKQNTTYKLVQG